MNKNSKTIRCRIVEVSKGTYSTLVVQDLQSLNFYMITVFPNWQNAIPDKNDKGFIEFEFAEAGTSYYNKDTKKHDTYLNTHFIFKNFINETPKNQEDITL